MTSRASDCGDRAPRHTARFHARYWARPLRSHLGANHLQARVMRRLLLVATAVTVALTAVPVTSADAATRYCIDRSYEDLRAKNISCSKAKRVYRASLSSCSGSPCRLGYAGRRWTCRARNTSIYTWRCTSGSRVVVYRWLSGE